MGLCLWDGSSTWPLEPAVEPWRVQEAASSRGIPKSCCSPSTPWGSLNGNTGLKPLQSHSKSANGSMHEGHKLSSSAVPQHRTEGMTSSDSHSESLLQHLLFVLIILCFICSKKGTSPSSSSFSCSNISAATEHKPSLSRRQILLETSNND